MNTEHIVKSYDTDLSQLNDLIVLARNNFV